MIPVCDVDPTSDMLTRIRNGLAAGKQETILPYSKFKHSFADLLVKQGWLEQVEVVTEKNLKLLKLQLKYGPSGEPVISEIKSVSKPGQRIYAKVSKIPRVTFGVGATIVSTSKGLMTDAEARRQKLGGELICQIW